MSEGAAVSEESSDGVSALITTESAREAKKRKAAAREERRIGSSIGYGLALYPTANLSLKASLNVAAKPRSYSLLMGAHSASRVGPSYQAELPALLSEAERAASMGVSEDERVGTLVTSPLQGEGAVVGMDTTPSD